MGGRMSKNKGSSFERKCAKMILKAAGPCFTSDDCYRTPMSGGHRNTEASDLVLSDSIRRIFPFSVEAKHRKTFQVKMFFSPTKHFKDELRQTIRATKKARARLKRRKDAHHVFIQPLLIIRGNNTPTFAVGRFLGLYNDLSLPEVPGIEFTFGEQRWKAVLVSALENRIAELAKRLKV